MDTEEKKISIIIRTCNRPNILREALESVRDQTYKNIEIIVVEDGKNISQKMLEEEFSDLNIRYAYTGEKKGRTVVGNQALSMSTGEYLNFLDDDDLLFPEHVKILVERLNEVNECAAYSIAYESVVEYNRKKGGFKEYKRIVRYQQPFNRTYLTFYNYIPIQCILFRRSLYEELGGFDESLDLLEDWDLWVRYSTRTDFVFVDKVTSLYRVPRKQRKRDIDMYRAYQKVIKKFKNYELKVNYYDLNQDLDYVLNYVKTPKWKRCLKKVRDKLLYR